MPSPFPGMDPYLEESGIWPDIHNALASGLRSELNRTLPSPFYALVKVRLVEIDRIKHPYVEVRDSQQDHKLITFIEILGPSNKLAGPDRDDYRRKQAEILASDANLIEIDLLRAGERILPEMNLGALIGHLEPPADYLVLVNRAWRRGEGIAPYEIFPCTLRDWLPCFWVPLTHETTEVPLDLQYVFNRAYDGGAYRRGAVDYSQPPNPPLAPEDAAWAETLLRALAPPQS